nr:MAG TPA: hypothetical protein [Bacteriophage sp.]
MVPHDSMLRHAPLSTSLPTLIKCMVGLSGRSRIN